jgi:hypothetical protein
MKLFDITRTLSKPFYLSFVDDDATGGGGEGDGGKKEEQPNKVVVPYKGKDPQTGKDYDFTEEYDLTKKEDVDKLVNRAAQGYRMEAFRGAQNVEIMQTATKLAKEMTAQSRGEMHALLATLKTKEEPGLKLPTAEEVEKDPQALQKYMDEHDARLLKKVNSTIEEGNKEKVEEQRMLDAYNTEIDRVCKEYKYVNRATLIKILKADGLSPLEEVESEAKKLNDDIVSHLKIENIPEEQRDAEVEEYLKKKKAPAAPPSGKTKEDEKKAPKTFDEIREQSAERAKGVS